MLTELSCLGGLALQNYSDVEQNVKEKLKTSVGNVQSKGIELLEIGKKFILNPSSDELRSMSVRVGQSVLMAVVRVLIIADMFDVDLILKQIEKVRDRLNDVDQSENTQELLNTCTNLDAELQELTEMTRKRLKDLRDPQVQDDMHAAIALLKVTTPLIISSSKAFIRHPELETVRKNREYAFDEMRKALDCFTTLVQSEVVEGAPEEMAVSKQGGPAELIINLEKFQRRVYMDPSEYRPAKHRPNLEELLERIASGSAQIADLDGTRHSRRGQIIEGVDNLRQALQDLLKEYERNIGKVETSEDLDLSKVYLAHKVRDLRRYLRRAVIDHVSDCFLDTQTPLQNLHEAAKTRDTSITTEAAENFEEHARKLINASRVVSELSSDIDGVRILRYAASLCEKIAPQVVNAAFLLCEKPDSIPIQENMTAFETLWLERLKVLTMATDSLISLDDFLAVTETHINEDCEQGIKAIISHEGETLDRVSGCIRGRSIRVCEVVLNEMEQYSQNQYTETVRRSALRLQHEAIPKFADRAERLVSEIISMDQDSEAWHNTQHYIDEMIEACQFIHDGVRDIRNSLLMNRNPEDVDSDNEYEDAGTTMMSDALDVRSQISDNDAENQQRIMRQLPQESKREIQKQIDVFKLTQRKFEYEVGKWDESSNDIIALAKHMCQIMMNMMDFTKGRGPYKTTMDIIKASQEISDDGAKLNALVRQIGNECVESTTKKDLFAYLERITLFCHQLNVTSKVKSDIQVVGDELRVSGLEAATSLIQNSKNLLNAVVLTVKAAYIASTKYRRKESTRPNVVEWRMLAPQKQNLICSPTKTKAQGVIRRTSELKQLGNIQTQFHPIA